MEVKRVIRTHKETKEVRRETNDESVMRYVWSDNMNWKSQVSHSISQSNNDFSRENAASMKRHHFDAI